MMKKPISLIQIGLLLPLAAPAQQYTLDWYKVSGGGGTP